MASNIRKQYLGFIFLCTSIGYAYGATESRPVFQISAVPLTLEKQMQQGVAGGEGFQLVMSIAYSPSNPDIVYMGSDTSQVWKSGNGGKSWVPSSQGYASLGTRSLFVHPRNENIVFSAGTLGAKFEKVAHKMPYQGIYRSTNSGRNWEMLHQTAFFKQESRGSLFAIDSRTLADEYFTLYVGTYSDGLLVSRDSGDSWQKTEFSAGEIFEIVELPDAPGSLLVASRQGLFRFDGKTQRRVGTGLPDWPRSIAVSPASPRVVYAALGDKGVYASSDSGENFSWLSSASPLLGSVNDIEMSPVDANIAMFTKSGRRAGPYYTHDAGEHWRAAKSTNSKELTDGGGFFFPSPIAMHPTNSKLALTSSNSRARILGSDDGGVNWSFSSSGYRGARLSHAIFLSAEHMIFNLTDHEAWQTFNGGKSFQTIEVPRMGGRSVGGGDQSGDTLVLAVGSWTDKHLLVSQDRGKTWADTKLQDKFPLVTAHATREEIFYAGPFRSDDKGRTWKNLEFAIAAVDPADSNKVYALKATDQGTQLLLSTDSGDTWKVSGAALMSGIKSVNQLEVDPFIPGRLYAATASGLRVFDHGKWQNQSKKYEIPSDAFGGRFVSAVMAHPLVSGLVFAGNRAPGKGMGNGLFYSTDHGVNWKQVPDHSLANTNIWSINVNPYTGDIYAGTSHGVYRVVVGRAHPH